VVAWFADSSLVRSDDFPAQLPSAFARVAATLLVGTAVTAAAVLGPDAYLDQKAAERFRVAADQAADPVRLNAKKQFEGLRQLALDVENGSSLELMNQRLGQSGWSNDSLLGDLTFVEFVNPESVSDVGFKRVLEGDTTGVAAATATDRETIVRSFDGASGWKATFGIYGSKARADIGIESQPASDAEPKLVWAPVSTMETAGIKNFAEQQNDFTESDDFIVSNEVTASTGVNVIAAAVPVTGRGWLVAIIRPVQDSSSGLARIVEIGDANARKTVGGLGIEFTSQKSRTSRYTESVGALKLDVAVLGPWRYGTPTKTYPIQTGLGLGGLTLALATWLGLRQQRRNESTMTSLVTTAQRQARTDVLTGLANRTGMIDAIADAGADEGVAVLLADLDRFKNVNDSRGHESGDMLLKAVAARFQRSAADARAVQSVARFGGDEFVVVLRGPKDTVAESAVTFADAILAQLRTPFTLGTDTVVISASIGLAIGTGADTESLLRDADIAMYAAKRNGGSRVAVADDELRRAGTGQLDLEIGIRHALANGEFIPFFQPIVDEHGNLHSFEALIRWQRPTGELVSPFQFLPAAKAAGLLGEVSTYMISAVCPYISTWNNERILRGEHPLTVHINCVEEQLIDLGFPDVVAALLTHYGVDPSWVMLEVSEETAVDRIPRGTPTLQSLRSMGVRFSLDDFGFGNSSLTMLRELGDVAELKLDKSIVDDIAKNVTRDEFGTLRPNLGFDGDVVEAILGFARRRGITIVAEGIEQPEQWEVLKHLGVQLFQGYLFNRPLPAEHATELALSERILSLN
jgi:diguanylate cyclase (GGDEF)-like protein